MSSFNDPFGLCHDKDGNDLPAAKCRDATAAEGRAVYNAAAAQPQWHWTESNKDVANHVGDCTDFVEASHEGAHCPTLNPRPSTSAFATSTDYRALGAGDTPQAGDVIVQGGHAGIFSGTYRNGFARGIQNGGHGTKDIAWGKGAPGLEPVDPVYYRRQLPRE